jgi:hypothetical protein
MYNIVNPFQLLLNGLSRKGKVGQELHFSMSSYLASTRPPPDRQNWLDVPAIEREERLREGSYCIRREGGGGDTELDPNKTTTRQYRPFSISPHTLSPPLSGREREG